MEEIFGKKLEDYGTFNSDDNFKYNVFLSFKDGNSKLVIKREPLKDDIRDFYMLFEKEGAVELSRVLADVLRGMLLVNKEPKRKEKFIERMKEKITGVIVKDYGVIEDKKVMVMWGYAQRRLLIMVKKGLFKKETYSFGFDEVKKLKKAVDYALNSMT